MQIRATSFAVPPGGVGGKRSGLPGSVKEKAKSAAWSAGANFTRSGVWVNTTFAFDAATGTVALTPVAPAAPGRPWLAVRYAASLWPQCAFYSRSNAVPARAFSDLAVAPAGAA